MKMPEVKNILMSELLQWYNLQRHDFMNHWQVIMGNLQLNQPERALAYMREMIAIGWEQEQKIAQIPEPGLAAILLGFVHSLRQEGVTATLDFPEEMKQKLFWCDHWQEVYMTALYGYTRECVEASVRSMNPLQSLNAEVYLYDEPGGLSCQFILADEENVLFDKAVKFTISPK